MTNPKAKPNPSEKTACIKAKNPCKYCLLEVNPKTGIQCMGACKTWVHFECLNYTPGKIQDIRSGVIKVTCPCPDCVTRTPKEIIIDKSYSCNNTRCPANNPPKCENKLCPSNLGKDSDEGCGPPGWPVTPCGKEKCKQFSATSECLDEKYLDQDPEGCFYPKCESGCSTADTFSAVSGNVVPTGHYSPNASIPANLEPAVTAMEEMCHTVGKLAHQINDLMSKMKECTREMPYSGGGAAGGHNYEKCANKDGPRQLCPKPCNCPEGSSVYKKVKH